MMYTWACTVNILFSPSQPYARPYSSVQWINDSMPAMSPRSLYLEMQLQSQCFVLLNYLLESCGLYLGTSSGKLDGPWLWAWTRSPIFSLRNYQAIDNRNWYIYQAALSSLWDLSSLTRNWTWALSSESAESSPLDFQEIPQSQYY